MIDGGQVRSSKFMPVRLRSLLGKYIAFFIAAVGVPLIGYTLMGVWLAAQEQQASQIEIQRANTASAANRIASFLQGIEGQLRFLTHLGWDHGDAAQHRLDALRVMKQVPAINHVAFIDKDGRERLVVSRTGVDQQDSQANRSTEPAVQTARRDSHFYGPVYFEQAGEPLMIMALSGARPEAGVILAEINITFAQDTISETRVGRQGQAYVIDRAGRVISHPDIAVVLRNTDASRILSLLRTQSDGAIQVAEGLAGQRAVLSYQNIPVPDWNLVLEIPEQEAREPLIRTLWRSSAIGVLSFLAALGIASILAYRMVRPIQAISDGAARIGRGELAHRIRIEGDDELAALGNEFNVMATELERARTGLEEQVEDRTRKLQEASLAKSRFLAAASHDLRQPLHALNLLVAQLSASDGKQPDILLRSRIEQAMASINGLFDNLLDVSRLEAGAVRADIRDFPLQSVFDHVEATFLQEAKGKDLALRCRPTDLWVRSDAILLQRILFNLVSNAVRYTKRGRVVVGVRPRGNAVRIEVWDSGIGIPEQEQARIFEDFYQVHRSGYAGQDARNEGLGLGLAIVARLASILGLDVAVCSRPGQGSCFRIVVPVVPAVMQPKVAHGGADQRLAGARILVIDDHEAILAGMAGLLREWGCEVLTARSQDEAIARLLDKAPDMILADLHIEGGPQGPTVIEALRNRFLCEIPAVIISGDVRDEARARAQAASLLLLEKPISPLRLRTVLVRLRSSALRASPETSHTS
ncbi:MAG: ATP-binding protein [Beijerinckiaceae bacterium]|nr:ATP-binding protein [Beijerinckiaceae bacterium]MCZ8299460.1 ATP-binding protein [Beijerinckiaceae bacterium]